MTSMVSGPRFVRHGLLIVAACLLLLLPLGWLWLKHHAEPIARRRIVESLEDKLHCNVELDAVHISVTHGLEVNGTGLRIMAIGNHARRSPGGTPMLSVRSFQFASTLSDLMFHPSSAITAYAQGLVLTLPAANDREPLQQGDPEKRNRPRSSLFLNKLVATDSRLVLESSKPGHSPVVLEFQRLLLVDDGENKPFVYETTLTNPKPVGEIYSTGHIGPWVFENSRQTPVDGNFNFSKVDLSSINGLEGTLSSNGRLSGTLGQIAAHGTTETPDFALDQSAHPFAVRTEFQALVDGTDGNTALQSVTASFLHTTFSGNGLVSRTPDGKGHAVALDVHMPKGRAEDLLVLFSKAERPLCFAAIALNGHLDVPPGHERLTLKIQATGRAALTGTTWSSPSVQEKIDALSLRAQDVHQAKEAINNPSAAPLVLSTMTGQFTIHNGMIDVSDLVYKMPGATLLGQGRYPLIERELDFHGVARTVASVAHMETGIKSVLLRPVSPLLRKHGAGMELPVSFTGDKGHPKFSLDLKNKSEDAKISAANHIKPRR